MGEGDRKALVTGMALHEEGREKLGKVWPRMYATNRLTYWIQVLSRVLSVCMYAARFFIPAAAR